MKTLNALEDRVLILQDQADVAQKAFDPNEARDPKGKWTSGGGSSRLTNTVLDHARTARGWVNTTRIGQAVNHVAGKHGPKAKEALATAVSLAVNIGHMGVSDAEINSFKHSLLHLSTNMNVTVDLARDHVTATVQRLRDMRKNPLSKAAIDPVDAHLERVITWVKSLDLTDLKAGNAGAVDVPGKANGAGAANPPTKAVNKLEDRLLVLQDKVDVAQKAFDPNEARDAKGKWSGSSGTAITSLNTPHTPLSRKMRVLHAALWTAAGVAVAAGTIASGAALGAAYGPAVGAAIGGARGAATIGLWGLGRYAGSAAGAKLGASLGTQAGTALGVSAVAGAVTAALGAKGIRLVKNALRRAKSKALIHKGRAFAIGMAVGAMSEQERATFIATLINSLPEADAAKVVAELQGLKNG